MAYTKTVWKDHIESEESGAILQYGTVITADRLNNMENGIEALDLALGDISGSVNELLEPLVEKVDGIQTAVTALQASLASLQTELTSTNQTVNELATWKQSVMNGAETLLVKSSTEEVSE